MPAEDLPYPLGKRHTGDPVDDNRLYGLLGSEALFEHIGLRPRINVLTRDEWRAFGGRLNGEMFAGLKKVFGSMTDIEAGRSGSPASMTSDAEFAAFGTGQSISPTDDPAHFFAFRSRDAEWIGFRWRDERRTAALRAESYGFLVEMRA
ncbi:hypothetical protein PQR66_19135 [Paraburkholderia agricolaris]|uniref:Uncharacterized protein n=1 Tax=Paraburkholderia agricolaris TaxID=2152888 RepID=A0ABW8ZRB5_9BURK